MARKRRRPRGPGRSGILGLLLLLLLAAAVGALIGSCAGKRASQVEVARGTLPAEHSRQVERSQPPDTSQPSSRGDRSEDRQGQASQTPPSPSAEPAEAPDEPDEAPTATVTEATPAAPPSPPSKPVRRYAGMSGETAYVRGAGNRVALTFDAGSGAAPTSAMLDTLRANGLRVTFFLTGKWCEQNPELTRRIAAEGHEIANHTYSHPDLRTLSGAAITSQLEKTDKIIHDTTGRPGAPFFRPPYGGRDRRVLDAAAKAGYSSVYWSLDSWDAYKKGITSTEIRNRVLERVQPGDVVLMHCGSKPTAEALPGMIAELQQRGYDIVAVSELLAAGR